MKYQVTGFNNFCRIFKLPETYPQGYCHGGGKPTMFLMVDWFNPVPGLPQWAISKEEYDELVSKGKLRSEGNEVEVDSDELQKSLTAFLKMKNYVRGHHKYLVICDFGLSFTFTQ